MGASELLALVLGGVLVIASSWLPGRAARWVGAALLGAVLVLVLRFRWGMAVAGVTGIAGAGIVWSQRGPGNGSLPPGTVTVSP